MAARSSHGSHHAGVSCTHHKDVSTHNAVAGRQQLGEIVEILTKKSKK